MNNFSITPLQLNDAFVIDNFFVGDNRGGFSKVFEKDIFREAGIEFSLNETFFSTSSKNVIRGLHFQLNKPQAKLVTVISGAVYDVIVDLRPDSSTFKSWVGVELTGENHKSLYVPKGFAHGFVSKADNTVMLYQCDGKYDKESDTGLLYNSPEIGIEWPIDESIAIHSEKDLGLMTFEEYMGNPMS